MNFLFFPHGATPLSGPGPPHFRGFTILLRHITVGRTPPDEWSDRRRNLHLTTHNVHNGQTSMPPAGFEPAIPESDASQAHALDRAATGKRIWYTLRNVLEGTEGNCVKGSSGEMVFQPRFKPITSRIKARSVAA